MNKSLSMVGNSTLDHDCIFDERKFVSIYPMCNDFIMAIEVGGEEYR